MAQQDLNVAQVRSIFEQMGGKAGRQYAQATGWISVPVGCRTIGRKRHHHNGGLIARSI